MFKRISLFVLTNIAIIALITLIITVLESVFGITISGSSNDDLIGVFIFSVVVGFSGAIISLWMSRYIAKKAYGIVLVSKDNIYKLSSKEKLVYDLVEKISQENNIKMPEVGFYISDDPNAFATGPTKNRSLVGVSSGLFDLMSEDEIEGVIGHEMSHILNGDMVTMVLLQGVMNTFVVFFSRIIANIVDRLTDGKLGIIGYVAINFILQIIFGILANFIVQAFSRHREFRADEGSAKILGKEKMILSLKALERYKSKIDSNKPLAGMSISNKSSSSGFMRLLSSHPDLSERVLNLENMQIKL